MQGVSVRAAYWRNWRALRLAKDKAENLCVICHRTAPEPGLSQCLPCAEHNRSRRKLWLAKQPEGKRSAITHRSNTYKKGEGWTAASKMPTEEFQVSMYPQGWDGPRATCVAVMPNGELCGKPGTVNRLNSDVKSYKRAAGQDINVLCTSHNSMYGTKTQRPTASSQQPAAAAVDDEEEEPAGMAAGPATLATPAARQKRLKQGRLDELWASARPGSLRQA